ncbi:PadR family transcriptional regulator [Glycomyces arizonensis]|uniref:PadR family transcriptional regulator n=1 Tax=Glycomyces arizonensis TaxID=256035 RepID=UPI00040B7167|nr:PadR family transcriptional regulator [Glycomyces arizonensis]
MAKRRKVGNLTALAVLGVVAHRPMHPYEMARALRGWGKDRDMPVKWGSLYSVVERMAERGLLEEAGTSREGRRPERTVYRITEEGREELVDWTRELLATPEREFPHFRAGLSVMAALPPDEVAALLRQRLAALEAQAEELRESLAEWAEVPRLFLVENEYDLAMAEAETAWVRSLLTEVESGSFPGLGDWRKFHASGEIPDELRELAERSAEEDKR